jgi:signal transduction histidine kinase
MTLATGTGPGRARVVRRTAAGLRALWRDLDPSAGSPLAPLAGQPAPWLAWLPHLLVMALAVVLGSVAGGQARSVGGASVGLAVVLGVAQGLPLALGLYRPLAGWWLSLLVGMLVSEVVRAGAGGSVWAEPSLLVHLGVLALVGLQAHPRVLVELWLLTLLAGAILVQRMPGQNASPDLAEMTALSAVVLIAAAALRGRGEARRRLAEQERISGAERAQRALLEERARIARELHDVVAHHMSVIAIQAEAAPYRVPDPPEELARSLATIRANAVEGLRELRRILGLLRTGEPDEEPLPQPALERLDDLVANVQAAGLAVTAAVTGAPRPLPPGLELSAYRIVQEALSNAMRHAPGSEVRVEVAYRAADLELRVANGPPRAQPVGSAGPGHGVLGMRERAAMLGGSLSAESMPDGGYTVRAVLPATEGDGR